ncbi:MAG: mechanosensitive ion channel [Paramuribaculum sp.]|nr:mechanosensitive ion channel [Paramuribaculum sp.]
MIQFDLFPSAADDTATADASNSVTTLKELSLDDLLSKLAHNMVDFSISLLVALIVFYVGKFIIRKLHNFTESMLLARKIDPSLRTFILSFIRIVLYFILIVTVIGILGVNTSSFLALFASAGVAIGMALSGTLQNFAGGVLILLLKPYKIGDFIETQGFAGTVKEIQIFSTIILTGDNKSIILPNGGLSTGSINNYSREPYRRLQWDIGITYGNDVATARKVILDILNSDDRVVKQYIEDDDEARKAQAALNPQSSENVADIDDATPAQKRSIVYRMFHSGKRTVDNKLQEIERQNELTRKQYLPKVDRTPTVTLGNLGASSVDLTVRAWVRSEFYWGVFYDMNERFYNELPANGISFPFPQLDVHLDTPAQA